MKDPQGHGSNSRGGPKKLAKPIPGHPYHKMDSMQLRYIQKDAHEAGRNAQEMGDQRGVNKYADQVNDASTVLGYRARGGVQEVDAAKELGSGTSKSNPAPVHDSMASMDSGPTHDRAYAGAGPAPAHWSEADKASYNAKAGYNEHGSRHGYSPDAVNSAIAAQNRSGRGKIGGREAKMIHALLKGR